LLTRPTPWLVMAAGGRWRRPGPGPDPGKGKGRHVQLSYLINMISESGSRAGGPCTVMARLCAGNQRVSRLNQFAFRRDATGAGAAGPARGPRGWAGPGRADRTVAGQPSPWVGAAGQRVRGWRCGAARGGRGGGDWGGLGLGLVGRRGRGRSQGRALRRPRPRPG
jgi:hypothetical protein